MFFLNFQFALTAMVSQSLWFLGDWRHFKSFFKLTCHANHGLNLACIQKVFSGMVSILSMVVLNPQYCAEYRYEHQESEYQMKNGDSLCQMKNGIRVKQKINSYVIRIKRNENWWLIPTIPFLFCCGEQICYIPDTTFSEIQRIGQIKKLLSVSSFYFRQSCTILMGIWRFNKICCNFEYCRKPVVDGRGQQLQNEMAADLWC